MTALLDELSCPCHRHFFHVIKQRLLAALFDWSKLTDVLARFSKSVMQYAVNSLVCILILLAIADHRLDFGAPTAEYYYKVLSVLFFTGNSGRICRRFSSY